MKNEIKMCQKCNEKPIAIKKYGLCISCYGKRNYERRKEAHEEWQKTGVSKVILYKSEIEFMRNYFRHGNWFYQPAVFRFNGTRYEPDFYDGERNVFIEVSGCRQAFHSNLAKYKDFIKTFPNIPFEIRQVNGELIDLKAGDTYHEQKEPEK